MTKFAVDEVWDVYFLGMQNCPLMAFSEKAQRGYIEYHIFSTEEDAQDFSDERLMTYQTPVIQKRVWSHDFLNQLGVIDHRKLGK